jgi:hypothetical protein
MAYAITHSFRTLTDGHYLWKLKELLVAKGWSVAASGDGVSAYNASGDVHTAYASMDNGGAWMRLRGNASMTPRRELLLQNVTGAGIMRCIYSSNGTGFTTGGDATTKPTASDQQLVVNLVGSSRVLPYEGQVYADFIVGGASESWCFFAGLREFGDEYHSHVLFLDVLQDANALDADPAVIGVELRSQNKQPFNETDCSVLQNKDDPAEGQGGVRGWFKKGLTGAAWVTYPVNVWGHNDGTTTALVSMTGAAKRWGMDDAQRFPELDAHYFRGAGFSTEKGHKGRSRLFKLVPSSLGGLRKNADGSRIAMGSLSLPWDGSSPVI